MELISYELDQIRYNFFFSKSDQDDTQISKNLDHYWIVLDINKIQISQKLV